MPVDRPATDDLRAPARRGQVWEFTGTAGQRVTIDLLSDDFDAYLYLTRESPPREWQNDDGGTGSNARLIVTLPEDGTYTVIVSSYSDNEAGDFTLQVSN